MTAGGAGNGRSGRGGRAFVTGWPLTATRSPLIHNTWARLYGLDATYEAVPVPPDEAETFLRTFAAQGYRGGNVTMPHKATAYHAADRAVGAAARMAAGGQVSANTLWREGDETVCDSTDGYGFLANLDERAPGWDAGPDRHALVMGAGGAAVAVVDALKQRRFSITLANRTLARAEALAAGDAAITPLPWDDLPAAMGRADLLVNTTALGMDGPESATGYPPDLAALPVHAIVTDLVYTPLRTPLLRAADARDLVAVDGLGMLLHQAVPGFERWFGVRPTVSAPLRRIVVRDLGEREPVFLGLTGSIGMGKSTTAAMFREAGVPVHDADATVHALYAGRAAPLIEAAFPSTTGPDGVDRGRLGEAVVGHPERMQRLESIVHPLVRAEELAFRRRIEREGHPLAVLDIPLLFETGGETRVDAVVVVSAPAEVQRERVLARSGMSAERFEQLLARQVPDERKRAAADMVIDTSQGLPRARTRVRDAVATFSDPDWMPTLRALG